MVDFDLIYEQHNMKDNLERDENTLSNKTEEHKNKMNNILGKLKEHPKKLNYSGGEKKANMLNLKEKIKSNNNKDFVKRFLK